VTATIYLKQYSLAGETTQIEKSGESVLDLERQAVATWETPYDELQLTTTTYYYNNVPVNRPFQHLNDPNNNPIYVVDVLYTFSDIAWRYAGDGEIIQDFCGKRGQVDAAFVCPNANIFQLVPALRPRGMSEDSALYFANNGCFNPDRVFYNVGGRLLVIPNDRVGTYGDNGGAFDVKVEVVTFLP
jgi:hypothetical protein